MANQTLTNLSHMNMRNLSPRRLKFEVQLSANIIQILLQEQWLVSLAALGSREGA